MTKNQPDVGAPKFNYHSAVRRGPRGVEPGSPAPEDPDSETEGPEGPWL